MIAVCECAWRKLNCNFCVAVTTTMSTITINVYSSGDAAQGGTAVGKRKRKNKRPRGENFEQRGYVEGKERQNRYRHRSRSRHNQTPRHNGACSNHPPPPTSTQNERLPLPQGASHSFRPSASFTRSLPSCTVTVSSKGSHEKPKEPVNKKPAAAPTPGPSASSSCKPTATPAANPTKYLAFDCEMVGAGPKGRISQLARCSIVSYDGDVVYDKFINPPLPITDYRTRWSGIRRSDLIKATPYSEARKEILRLLNGKVVIGHAVHNDFKVLSYTHPTALTRDTSRIPLLNQKAGFAENECASLKRLTKAIFNRDIQTGKRGHSSVEDAKATMELYKVVEEEWERWLASKQQAR
ncbi:interferon-stimulated 20 kDa exonuclease-like 2 [Seriola lalandi dorsalis]|uniref:Interferon stimulated exonuclease gene 20 like 2 n=1 Tax=Seriola lalandi dorsalis TaxID=1841481 RepID=A0A3B4YIR4_SERLL|nr:interferon-stimulated 20 kDa exonuclease-like 2 [Seriola lalandi dorsalis]XP_023279898.1 interferon-stimulated 20 kDa exonuclease-like 2 [Seriola lalandi dorsalis]XP_056236652.1 interferon-stimulated 20 kDa exonuclease-like 2 [Seriola aureovittata]XP_056236653.1 interferon-stimulated 20 kDa exonuclease-like 2 [Seriola aureovittata]